MPYVILDRVIKQLTERELAGRFCHETTTPHGVGPDLHRRGREIWRWGHQGNSPRCVMVCVSAIEAQTKIGDLMLSEARTSGRIAGEHDTLDDAARELARALVEGDTEVAAIIEAINTQDTISANMAVRAELHRFGKLPSQAEFAAFKEAAMKRELEAVARTEENKAHQRAHVVTVAAGLSIDAGYVVFRGGRFAVTTTEAGSIQIDRDINRAARAAGLAGQEIGLFYGAAQRLAAQSIIAASERGS